MPAQQQKRPPLPERSILRSTSSDPFAQLEGIHANEYLFAHLVGIGGKSYVYEAINENTRGIENPKVLNEKNYNDLGRRNLFYFESRLGANIHKHFQHINIAGIRNAGTFNYKGLIIPYAVLEHDGGMSLTEYLALGNIFSFKEILTIMEDSCAGASYGHSEQVYNEDIKIKNIRRVPTGRGVAYKLSDYGRFNDKIKELFKRTINDLHTVDIKEHIFNVDNIYLHPQVTQEIRDEAFIADLQGLGKVFRELLETSGHPITKPLELIIEQTQEPTKTKNFKDAEEISNAIKNYQRVTETRRKYKIIGAAAAGLITLGTGAISADYFTSPRYIQDQLARAQRTSKKSPLLEELAVKLSEDKLIWLANRIPKNKFPYGTTSTHEWFLVDNGNWTDGFWPGLLWTGYALTGNKKLKDHAIASDNNIIFLKEDTQNIRSFRFLHSHGQQYHITQEPEEKEKTLKAARFLSQRFNQFNQFLQTTGEIKEETKEYNLKLNSLRVLSLLWFGYNHTEGPEQEHYKQIITTQLNKVRDYCIRPDATARDVAIIDVKTGQLKGELALYAMKNNTTHTTSQLEAAKAFIEGYEYLRDERYSETALKLVHKVLITNNNMQALPYDLIAKTGKDNSANVMLASTLMDLYERTNELDWKHEAEQQIISLAKKEILSTKHHYQGFIKHCKNSKKQYTDSSLIQTDYLFFETIKRILS